MMDSISGSDAAASALGVGKALKSAGVTVLTVTSVVCAESAVAMTSCHAEVCVRAQTASG